MQKYIQSVQNNPILSAVIGVVFIFSLFFGVTQGTRCKKKHAMQFRPGTFAAAFLLDYLLISLIITEDFPDFKYASFLFPAAFKLGGVTAVLLWRSNYKRLGSAAETMSIIFKQLIASICAAPFVILLPLLIIMSVSGASDSSRQAKGKSRRHHKENQSAEKRLTLFQRQQYRKKVLLTLTEQIKHRAKPARCFNIYIPVC